MNPTSQYFDEESPKAEILQAAMEEFIQFGKKGARMQAIADRAGVNKALLHYYFSSKENLHKEVIKRIFQSAFSRISESLTSSDEPEEQMRELISAYFDFIRTFPELPRLMLHEITTNPEAIEKFFAPLLTGERNYPEAILDMIRSGIESGQFRKVDPQQFMITVISTIIFYFIAKPVLTTVLSIEDEEEFLDRRKQHIQDVLLTYLERK
jgi:AcrR family transcriptional regulator